MYDDVIEGLHLILLFGLEECSASKRNTFMGNALYLWGTFYIYGDALYIWEFSIFMEMLYIYGEFSIFMGDALYLWEMLYIYGECSIFMGMLYI